MPWNKHNERHLIAVIAVLVLVVVSLSTVLLVNKREPVITTTLSPPAADQEIIDATGLVSSQQETANTIAEIKTLLTDMKSTLSGL